MITQDEKFKLNWDFQKQYYGQVMDILRYLSYMWTDYRPGTEKEDMKQATDFVPESYTPAIAVRIRRTGYQTYKDMTIRTYKNGHKTEIHKLREGFGDYYLYCWTDDRNNITEYWFIDLDNLRESGLLSPPYKEKENSGGNTRFMAITKKQLLECGALLTGL